MKIDTLRRAFREREFTRREAATVLGSPDPDALLTAMKTRGWIERVGRGTYRLRPAEAYSVVLERTWDERIRRVLTAPLRVALDGPDAVRLWTRGAYNVGETPGSRTLYLAVHPRDEPALRAALVDVAIPAGSQQEPPLGTGLRAIIRPWPGFRKQLVEGLPVIPLSELRRIARESPMAYEGFEEWVEE